MRYRVFIIVIIFFCNISSHAQNKYFPLRGRVISADSLSPIPNAHILSELSYYGTTSDFNGKFSMLIRNNDSLRISSIGFSTKVLNLNYDSIDVNNFEIILERDTIILQEIDIFPNLDYHTVKKIISEIPVEKPFIVKGANDDIADVLYQKPRINPRDKGIISPIQTLYNHFNKKEIRKRKMIKNRKRYNREMEKIGADSLLLPEKLEF